MNDASGRLAQVCRRGGDGHHGLYRWRRHRRISEGGDWRRAGRVCGELVVWPLDALPQPLGRDEPATQIVLLFLLPFASYLIAEHIGVSGIGGGGGGDDHHPFRRDAHRALGHAPARQQHRAMLEFVFNGMVFLLLGLQLPDILSSSLVAAEADPNVETGCCLPTLS